MKVTTLSDSCQSGEVASHHADHRELQVKEDTRA
jgi:hypothetical protein